MARLQMLIRKEIVVFPRPLMILIKVVFTYKKGQIHANVRMKSPAKVLSNMSFPIKEPKKRKSNPQKAPKEKPNRMTLYMRDFNCLVLEVACISATVGSNMVDTEFVNAVGKRIQGRAIPVKTP